MSGSEKSAPDPAASRLGEDEHLRHPRDARIAVRPDAHDPDGAVVDLSDEVVVIGTHPEESNVRIAPLRIEGEIVVGERRADDRGR